MHIVSQFQVTCEPKTLRHGLNQPETYGVYHVTVDFECHIGDWFTWKHVCCDEFGNNVKPELKV